MLEAVKALVEPVVPPKGQLEYQRYFVGDPEDPAAIKEREARRHAFYKAVGSLVRAYANIADEMEVAGYHDATRVRIKAEVEHFQAAKQEVMLAAGEHIDLKEYEPGMRQLIDWYLDAKHARSLSKLNDMTLVELILQEREDAFEAMPESMQAHPEAMAETIEHNIRKAIVEERATNPAYFEKMSTLLDELIQQRREQTKEYEELLRDYVDLTRQVKKPESTQAYPSGIDTSARRALYDNLGQNETLSLALDEAVQYTRQDAWRDNKIKTRKIRLKVESVLKANGIEAEKEIDELMDIIKSQREY